MKFKKLFAFAGLGVLALGSAAVGLFATKETKKAEAATSETTFYLDVSDAFNLWTTASITDVGVYTWGGSDPATTYIYASGSDDHKGALSSVTVSGKTYLSFSMVDRDYTGFLVYCWDKNGSAGNSSNDVSFATFTEGQNLITLTNSGSWSIKHGVTYGTLNVGTTYTVTKYAVYDGVVDTTYPVGTDTVSAGETYPVPARLNHEGYHYGGWFTNTACTTPYTATAINADTPLYVKYTTLSKDSYIYYVTSSEGPTSNKIHTWGGDYEYPDGGSAIPSLSGVTEVHGVVNYRGASKNIYRIPVSSESGDTAFQFYYGSWESKSSEKVLAGGSAYYWEDEAGYNAAASGDAIDFILAVEAKRNAATWKGKSYSACGISQEDADDLCDTYNDLTATARGYVDASSTKTWVDVSSSEETQVSFYDIMDLLAEIAERNDLTGHTTRVINSPFATVTADSSTMITIVAIIALTSITAVAIVLVIRKRKHN